MVQRKEFQSTSRRQRLIAFVAAIATVVLLFDAVASISARYDAANSTLVQNQQPTQVAQAQVDTVRH